MKRGRWCLSRHEGISFYDALPPDIEEDFSRAFGCKIAHTFTTGWEIGVLKGIENRKKEHKGEYIVIEVP